MADVDHSQSVFPFMLAVELAWNGSTQARYVRADNDQTLGGDVYTATPRMEFESGEHHGGTEPTDFRLKISAGLSPFDLAVKEPHATITCTFYEVDKATGNMTCVYKGEVKEVWQYLDGESDINEIVVQGPKSKLKVRLGIASMNTCAWNFGDGNCQATPESYSADIVDITAERITFNSLTNSGNSRWFQNGYVEFQGLRMRIRKHLTSPVVWLTEPPPAAWDGQTVTVVQGCLKDITDCDARNNLIHFGGFGRVMPRHEPRFEDRA